MRLIKQLSMTLHEGQPRNGNPPSIAGGQPTIRYVLERVEHPDKAQRNERPNEGEGQAWTESEAQNVQPQQ